MKINRMTLITASIIGLLAEQTVLGSNDLNGGRTEAEALAAALNASLGLETPGVLATSVWQRPRYEPLGLRELFAALEPEQVHPNPAAPTAAWQLTFGQIQADFPGHTINIEGGHYVVRHNTAAPGSTSTSSSLASFPVDSSIRDYEFVRDMSRRMSQRRGV